jgi:hypothetical protein
MESDPGRRRLDPHAADDWTNDPGSAAARSRAAARRDAGVWQTRRISTWTAAALVAGVAASAGYFAHAVAAPAPASGGAAITSTAAAPAATGHKPSLTHPVVTSGGSGVVAGAAGGSAGGSAGGGGGTVHWRDN